MLPGGEGVSGCGPEAREAGGGRGKGKGKAPVPEAGHRIAGQQSEPKRRKAGSSSKSSRSEEPAGRSRRELQEELSGRGVKFNKTAKKGDLLRLIAFSTSFERGASDLGAAHSPLQVALCTNAFFNQLGSFAHLGKLGCVSKSFQSVLASRMAWEQVSEGMHLITKKLAREVLAMPDARIATVNGPPRTVHSVFGVKTYPPNKLYAKDAVKHALEFHGSAEQMYLARGKKMEVKRKNALKPKKPRAPRRSRGGPFGANTGMLALMMQILNGIGVDDMYDSDDDDYGDEYEYGSDYEGPEMIG